MSDDERRWLDNVSFDLCIKNVRSHKYYVDARQEVLDSLDSRREAESPADRQTVMDRKREERRVKRQ